MDGVSGAGGAALGLALGFGGSLVGTNDTPDPVKESFGFVNSNLQLQQIHM